MLRAHEMALDVNDRQATLLVRRLCPVAYNHALRDFKDSLDAGECATIGRSGRAGTPSSATCSHGLEPESR